MARKTTKRKTTKRKTKRAKQTWKMAGEEFISVRNANKFASKINNRKSGIKARVKKNGRGRTRATINGKGVLGKYNKNGTFTINTFTVETTKTNKKS